MTSLSLLAGRTVAIPIKILSHTTNINNSGDIHPFPVKISGKDGSLQPKITHAYARALNFGQYTLVN